MKIQNFKIDQYCKDLKPITPAILLYGQDYGLISERSSLIINSFFNNIDHKQNSLFSGIYYLKVPPLSGDLKFRKKNLEGWDELKIRAVEGKMVLFKSELSHSVNRNNSLSKRVSLAFNMFAFPVELGTDNSDYTRNNFY